ncbi:brain-enriched guanylate kinase-associated protein isoform X3 [Panthera onca]
MLRAAQPLGALVPRAAPHPAGPTGQVLALALGQRAAGAEGRAAQAAVLHHAQAREARDRVRLHAPLPGDRAAARAGGAREGHGEAAQPGLQESCLNVSTGSEQGPDKVTCEYRPSLLISRGSLTLAQERPLQASSNQMPFAAWRGASSPGWDQWVGSGGPRPARPCSAGCVAVRGSRESQAWHRGDPTVSCSRIQSNYMALQRINQELEDKLYRMGQHYEEEKRALSHEIVALNSHLLEAKVTIDKLSEDNELYRKDCNLAAQLLQCSQTYGRVHKVSELPSDFQERVSLHLEKHGCGLPSPLCHPAYADSVPTCVIAKVLEKPDPASLSSRLSDASACDLAFRDGGEKPGPRPPYKGDIYCSDTALYCPEERRHTRRPSVDAPVTDVGFLRAQNSTDSAAEEEEEAEAAAFPAGFRHEAFPGYAGSLPTSSSYSSFSATSEEKEHAQASTLTASQQAIYLNSRDELFDRKPPAAAYEGSPRFAKATASVAAPLEAEVAPGFARTMSPYPAESFRFPASPGPQQALMPPNLWSLRAKPGTARLPGEDARGQWRPLSVEDIGAYSYPATAAGRASPCSFSERYYGSGGSPGKKAEGRASPLYATYKADSFSEGDDLSQGHLAEPRFLRAGGDLSLSPGRAADPLPGYAPSQGDAERLGVQLCGAGGSPEPEHSPHSSRDSLEPSSMEASPEMHPAARLSPQPAFPRTGGSGLSRKDSLTKAQLYGTLLN